MQEAAQIEKNQLLHHSISHTVLGYNWSVFEIVKSALHIINRLGKVNRTPQSSDIWSLSLLYQKGSLSNTDCILHYRELLISQGHAIDCLRLPPDLMNKQPDLVVHRGGFTCMMHDAGSMVRGSREKVGRRQAWLLGTTGLSAGIYLQSQHEANKKKSCGF